MYVELISKNVDELSEKEKAEIDESIEKLNGNLNEYFKFTEYKFLSDGVLTIREKELERLERELQTASNEIARASGKLSNNGFLEKAPKSLVDSERAKLNKYIDIRDKIMSQIKDLKG